MEILIEVIEAIQIQIINRYNKHLTSILKYKKPKIIKMLADLKIPVLMPKLFRKYSEEIKRWLMNMKMKLKGSKLKLQNKTKL